MFRQNEKNGGTERKGKGKADVRKGHKGRRKVKPRPTKVIEVPQLQFCPKHPNEMLRSTERISRRLIIDLVPMKTGIRKSVAKYVRAYGYCQKCHRSYAPTHILPEIWNYHPSQRYGHRYKAWIVYQRVGLRMPFQGIVELMEEQFGIKTDKGTISRFIVDLARYYAETEEKIIQSLLGSPFIHTDETKISIKGVTQYIWVFTDGKHVIFKLSRTREAAIVHEFLADYNDILISDFYPGYDSVECVQQKCWVHLIRDINNDLWSNPFDTEFEAFVSEVRGLVIPIMGAVQKYGLKKRNLGKYRKSVAKFYKEVLIGMLYRSELALKYQTRFIRYRESLFTFLEQDGIPWHNNTAENAIRHIVRQRMVSEAFVSESATRSYLLLLSIRQTLRFQNRSFLKFLFSGEKDIDQFKGPRRARK